MHTFTSSRFDRDILVWKSISASSSLSSLDRLWMCLHVWTRRIHRCLRRYRIHKPGGRWGPCLPRPHGGTHRGFVRLLRCKSFNVPAVRARRSGSWTHGLQGFRMRRVLHSYCLFRRYGRWQSCSAWPLHGTHSTWYPCKFRDS